MRYALKQRLWQRRGTFRIQDDAGEDVMTATPTVLSTSFEVVFRDLAGRELLAIRNRAMSVRRTWDIYRGGEPIAVIVGGRDTATFVGIRFDIGKPTFRFDVDVPGPDDLVVKGSIEEHEYTMKRGDRTVATVSKTWFSWDDSYGVEIVDGEDIPLVLASTVAIDIVIGYD
ncbi:MAG: LURP-one-related family protein [Myxococcales bacterium]|nr:LURP-one-related family protein [Myxococcales bacterium]